jgi:glycosyltransferase involved in cell wall biosynthesis
MRPAAEAVEVTAETTGAVERGERLAVVGGFLRPAPSAAHGTAHSAFALCAALARTGRYRELDVFLEEPERAGMSPKGALALPEHPPARVLDRGDLQAADGRYSLIYVANGEQMSYAPHVLRPETDWVPVVCEVGTLHALPQWSHFFISAVGGAIRPTDGFVFKSQSALRLFRDVWESWAPQIAGAPLPVATVVPNGVDVDENARDEALGQQVRRQLGLRPPDVAFLAFSRLSPGTKGDQRALVALWRRVVERCPDAVLVLSGAQVDRTFVLELRTAAAAAGVAHRVIVVENPFELWPRARTGLMSAADVFVHLSTGVEEVAPMVVHEAMAHGLPILASDWAGLSEIVTPGEEGFLARTVASAVPTAFRTSLFGLTGHLHAIQMNRCAACDAGEVVELAVKMATSGEMRLRMAGQARRTAVERHGLARVARSRVEFFDELSRRAESSPPPSTRLRPLVDGDAILQAQAGRSLGRQARVVVADRAAASFLLQARDDTPPGLVRVALQLFDETPEMTAEAFACAMQRRLTGEGGGALEEEAWRVCGRLLVRLLSYGVVRIDG